MSRRDGWIQFGCFTFCLVLAVLIMILAASIKTLEVNTFGLDYNPIYKTLNDQVYQSGIHWIGFGHYFIEYPQ